MNRNQDETWGMDKGIPDLPTAKETPTALPLSSSLYISPMTAAPITGPIEVPIDWKNLQNNREWILCAAATPAEPIANTSKVYR